MSVWRLLAVYVMHRLAVEFRSPLRRTLTAGRHRAMIAVAKIEAMIDMTVEVFRPVEPGTRSNKDPA